MECGHPTAVLTTKENVTTSPPPPVVYAFQPEWHQSSSTGAIHSENNQQAHGFCAFSALLLFDLLFLGLPNYQGSPKSLSVYT